jgi:sodium transport system ATP-binding protein
VIAAEGLGKRFGAVEAVRGVSFTAADGRVTGLLGPNGAGKTTTLRMISTLLAPSAGTVRVDGVDASREPLAVRARIGALSDARGLYARLTARENIAYFGELRGLARAPIAESIARLARLLELEPLLDRRTEGFSQGERMKVAIARALVHDPPNVILDEPTNGLDVMTTRSLREAVRQLREAGKCVLFSSHVMQEVAALCDDIVIVSHGVVVAEGTPEAIRAAAGCEDLEEAFVRLTGAGDGVGGEA